MTTPRFFRPPQQVRSRRTLDLILDATEQVLETKTFGEATLAEIMDRAGVTVGAFYRRFPDKDALLHLLDEHAIRPSDYEGPGSFASYLVHRAPRQKVEMISIAAEIPNASRRINPPSRRNTQRVRAPRHR